MRRGLLGGAIMLLANPKLAMKSPDDYQQSANAKLLAAIHTLIFQTVPADPTAASFRQGSTLGGAIASTGSAPSSATVDSASFSVTAARRKSSSSLG